MLVLWVFVDYIFLYKVICFSMVMAYFCGIHKIDEDCCEEYCELYWILSLIIFVICFARLLACSFFLYTGKEERTKKENRRLSLQSYSEPALRFSVKAGRERENPFSFFSSFFSSFSLFCLLLLFWGSAIWDDIRRICYSSE